MTKTDPLVAALQQWTGTLMRSSMHSLILFTRENDLSMTQIGALFQIRRGRTNVSDLGEGLGITIAAASQMLERLVQLGLIRRSEDPQDRRVKKLLLTDKGCRIVEQSMHARQGWFQDLASRLTAAEREQVAAALHIMLDRANQLDQGAEPS